MAAPTSAVQFGGGGRYRREICGVRASATALTLHPARAKIPEPFTVTGMRELEPVIGDWVVSAEVPAGCRGGPILDARYDDSMA